MLTSRLKDSSHFPRLHPGRIFFPNPLEGKTFWRVGSMEGHDLENDCLSERRTHGHFIYRMSSLERLTNRSLISLVIFKSGGLDIYYEERKPKYVMLILKGYVNGKTKEILCPKFFSTYCGLPRYSHIGDKFKTQTCSAII